MDVASKLVFVHHMPNLTAAFAVQAKHALERMAASVGVNIQEYLTDNQPFRAKEFVQDCENSNQLHTLSGVGAHHQNRVERTVQTIFNWSRAMMLHFIMHWPQEAQLELWPFAVSYAVWLWNNMPDTGSRVSPLELFMGVTFDNYRHLQRARVFGCPVYVLDAKLQDAKSLPKWKKRSYRGIFLGFSDKHHSTVALVLNPETGVVSPQYHVVFDERFSTVLSEGEEFDHSDWEKLFDIGHERYLDVHPDDEDSDAPIILPPDVDMWPAHSRKTRRLDEFSETGTQATVPTEDSSAQTNRDGSVQQREIQTQTSEDEDVPRRERTIRFADEVTVRDVPSEPYRQVSRTRSDDRFDVPASTTKSTPKDSTLRVSLTYPNKHSSPWTLNYLEYEVRSSTSSV
jgi:hypothetical protein